MDWLGPYFCMLDYSDTCDSFGMCIGYRGFINILLSCIAVVLCVSSKIVIN